MIVSDQDLTDVSFYLTIGYNSIISIISFPLDHKFYYDIEAILSQSKIHQISI
jgi:hypothetical protein